MINPKELRIGNIVSVNGKFNVCVKEIDCNGITYDRVDGSEVAAHCKWKYLDGIYLTEDVVLKSGFIKFNTRQPFDQSRYYSPHTMLFDLFTRYPSGRLYVAREVGEKRMIMIREIITHLHELQNIFYSLTGKELMPNL